MTDNSKDKMKLLEDALAQIEKKFGKGAIMRMDQRETMNVETISTGCLSLDIALGIGGIPRGRIIEIFGPEASGKTTVALHLIAEAQKAGGTCAFIDAEHALDPFYAAKLGVKLDALYISQPDNGEQALEIVDSLVNSQAVDLIVVDSVAALTPQAEIDGEMGDQHMGLQARLMSQALRKLTASSNKNKTSIIFINQLRDKMSQGGFGGPTETTTGGKALKFYASVRMDIRRIESIKDGTDIVGNVARVRIVKNKVAPPFKVAEFEILFGQGISRMGCILDLATELKFIVKSGSWYSYNEEKIGQGRDRAIEYLKKNPDIADDLELKIKAAKLA
ncbi:MAG: recombinase RecA [Christensenellales bacterium]|jgi:recombination protein RecA|nr:recombinase RecA [Eubacteriales bacterium]